jgi:hypothetical protein
MSPPPKVMFRINSYSEKKDGEKELEDELERKKRRNRK